MATKSHDDGVPTTELTVDPTAALPSEDVDEETPDRVYVEVSSNGRSLMAIVAAGVAGRWSFDFRVDASGIEVVRAYEEGHRINVDELPAWMDAVEEAVEKELQ